MSEMKTQSPGVAFEEKAKEERKPRTPESEQETKALAFYLRQAEKARNLREQEHREFDGMSYMKDYQFNLDASISYLQPKANPDDVRVNTATTEKKIEAIMNELLAMNIQHEIHAFDDNDREFKYLGKDFEHIVTRTNQIEREDDVMLDIIRELLTQRAVFVKEEIFVQHTRSATIKRPRKVLVPGRKVYLGDIYIPAYRFNEQPYYIEYDRMSYRQAETMFKDRPNWKFVVPGGKQATNLSENDLYSWRMHSLENDEVEILRYYSLPDNEYQVVVNGVLMEDLNTPLPQPAENGYNMTMIVVKPIRQFAYGKSPLSSAKTIQALENEMTRNLIRKFRQSIEPPLVSAANSLFSRDMFSPGAITSGVNKDDLQLLIDNPGVTQSEFQVYQLINEKVAEFVGVSNIFQGQNPGKEMTATQTLEQLKQALKMLGLVIFAMIRLRRDVTYLRINNLLTNFIDESRTVIDKKTNALVKDYLQFTLKNADLEDGRKGTKVIKFMDRDLTQEEEQSIYEYEEVEADKGNLVRLRTINKEKLKEFPLFFYVTAQQKEREGSALQKIMFQQELAQAAQIEQASQGQVKVNWNSAAEKMELTWGTRNLFQKQAPNTLSQQTAQDPKVQEEANNILSQLEQIPGVPKAPQPEQLLESARRVSRPQPPTPVMEGAIAA